MHKMRPLVSVIISATLISSTRCWGVGSRWNSPSSDDDNSRSNGGGGGRNTSSLPFLILFIAVCFCCLFCLKIICGRCGRGREDEEEEESRRERRRQRRRQQRNRNQEQEQQQQQLNGSSTAAASTATLPSISGEVSAADVQAINLFLSQRGEFVGPSVAVLPGSVASMAAAASATTQDASLGPNTGETMSGTSEMFHQISKCC